MAQREPSDDDTSYDDWLKVPSNIFMPCSVVSTDSDTEASSCDEDFKSQAGDMEMERGGDQNDNYDEPSPSNIVDTRIPSLTEFSIFQTIRFGSPARKLIGSLDFYDSESDQGRPFLHKSKALSLLSLMFGTPEQRAIPDF